MLFHVFFDFLEFRWRHGTANKKLASPLFLYVFQLFWSFDGEHGTTNQKLGPPLFVYVFQLFWNFGGDMEQRTKSWAPLVFVCFSTFLELKKHTNVIIMSRDMVITAVPAYDDPGSDVIENSKSKKSSTTYPEKPWAPLCFKCFSVYFGIPPGLLCHKKTRHTLIFPGKSNHFLFKNNKKQHHAPEKTWLPLCFKCFSACFGIPSGLLCH